MISVALPNIFRLDLAVQLLHRFSPGLIEAFENGVYRRALPGGEAPRIFSAVQSTPTVIDVAITGASPGEDDEAAEFAARLFGVYVDLAAFEQAARRVPWLAPLVAAQRGLKPVRYPTLWEACVNAIVFQSVSLHAASAVLGRMLTRYTRGVDDGEHTLRPFPLPRQIAQADPAELKSFGLSTAKVVALQATALAIEDGRLDEVNLAALSTPDLTAELRTHRGIGPWTAAIIAMRGFGRLDFFPMNDSGIARRLRILSGTEPDVPRLLEILGAQQSMLYYHLSIPGAEMYNQRAADAMPAGVSV